MFNTPSPVATLRETLRKAVAQAPMSKQDLAQRAGISRRALYSLLEGEADPRLSTLEALSHVLGLELFMAPKVASAVQLGSPSTGKRSEHSRVRRLLEEGAGDRLAR